MSQPTDARDLRTRIADDIRAMIETGQLQPGDQLPSITTLRARYECSPDPARGAIELLRQQGLTVTRPGLGVFVRERPAARRHGIFRYRRSVWQQGRKLMDAEMEDQGMRADPQVNRYIGQEPAPAAVAQRYGVEPGTMMHVRKRTTGFNGRHNQIADSWYPLEIADAAPAIKQDETGPGGGIARIEEAGYHLVRIREEISVRMPTSPESGALRLPDGTPVVELIRTIYDDANRIVEVMVAVVAGDMIAFDYEFEIPD